MAGARSWQAGRMRIGGSATIFQLCNGSSGMALCEGARLTLDLVSVAGDEDLDHEY